MSAPASDQGTVSAAAEWFRGLWEYYRGYTKTAVHPIAAAALTGFGLLIFINPLFALLAIASYLFPPIVLYVLDADVGKPSSPEVSVTRADTGSSSNRNFDADSDSDDGDGGDDGDTDFDGADADADGADADADGADADADGADADADSADADADRADADTDG